jgi:hypothetical protein
MMTLLQEQQIRVEADVYKLPLILSGNSPVDIPRNHPERDLSHSHRFDLE